jgi:hypothetical protein
MTRKEQRDYIAIQAMTGMIHNDSMMVDKAATLRTSDCDQDNLESVVELVEASYNIADLMMQESDRREKEAIDENQSA